MKFLILLLMMLPLDKGVKEKVVVVDYVDLVEVNHKYYESNSPPEIKRQFIQVIFWEYRNSLLLPEYKEGVKTGNWHRGSGFVVVDYITVYNLSYAVPVKKAESPP